MSFRLVDRDHGFKRLLANVRAAARGAGVSVGVHAKDGAARHKGKEPVSVLDVAIFNEFGLGVPERSFIRAWVDEGASKHAEMLRRAMQLVIKGQKTLPEVLELLGLKFVGEIQQRISRGIPPPNAPSTVKKKGSSKPLINTGQLRQAVTYLVRLTGARSP